jgi:hypothetical protein
MSFFYDYNHFNPLRIQCKTPSKRLINDEQYIFVPLRYKKKPIYIKTPKIYAPFGLNIYSKVDGSKNYSYVVSFNDRDIDPLIENLLQFLHKVDQFCQSIVEERVIEWGGQNYSSLNYKSALKTINDPLLRLKITPSTELYDEVGFLHDIDDIEQMIVKQCHIISLIELNNIWINTTEFGITWKVLQVKTYPPTRPIGGISLLEENIHIPHDLQPNIISSLPIASPPPVPPPVPPPLPLPVPQSSFKIKPYMVNCFAAINRGCINLKKTEQVKYQYQPLVSLQEVLNIRNNLKKTNI